MLWHQLLSHFSPMSRKQRYWKNSLFFMKQQEASSKPGLTIKDKGFSMRKRFSGLATKLRFGRAQLNSPSLQPGKHNSIPFPSNHLLHIPGKSLQSQPTKTPFCLACKWYSQIRVPSALHTKEKHLDGIQSSQTPACLCEVGMHSLQRSSGCRCLW